MRSDQQQNGVHVGDITSLTVETPVVKPPRSFEYVPLPDITAFELALLLEVVMTSVACGDLDAAYERLPPEAKRHLRIT